MSLDKLTRAQVSGMAVKIKFVGEDEVEIDLDLPEKVRWPVLFSHLAEGKLMKVFNIGRFRECEKEGAATTEPATIIGISRHQPKQIRM